MNAKMKQRLIVVTGIIVIVAAILLAVVGGNSAAKTIALAEATDGSHMDQRIQVTGNVVQNSYSTSGNVLTFSIYDPDNADAGSLVVKYDGAAASTFGNDVTAICTGKIDSKDGIMYASELVTKCPSKYESGAEALQVARMISYGNEIANKTVKVTGCVVAGSQSAAGSEPRFVLADNEDATQTVDVNFDGALSEETIKDGASVVLTGHMNDAGAFDATDVALEG